MKAAAGSYRDGLVARLRYLIELHGRSVTQVEKELGRSRGFVGDALRGGKRLPLETVLEVLDLLQVDPVSFFVGATADGRRWGVDAARRSAAAEVEERGERLPKPDEVAALSRAVAEIDRTLSAVLRLLEERGYLSRAELDSALGSPGGSGRRS